MLNKILVALLVAAVVLVLLFLFAVRSVNRTSELTGSPAAVTSEAPLPSLPTTAIPTATPEVLTPDQEQLSDLEAEEQTRLTIEDDFDTNINQIDAELRGL